jgi:hypothetical protein
MTTENSLKSICSAAAMAKKLSLSRSRFYDLLDKGIFPKAVNCPDTDHKFYTLELQQQCFEVKQTGIGVNGQPVLFYLPRKHRTGREKLDEDAGLDCFSMKLFGLLKNMGANLGRTQLRAILKTMYPDGVPEWPVNQEDLKKILNYSRGGHKSDV